MVDSGGRELYTLKLHPEYCQLVLPHGAEAVRQQEEQILQFGCGDPISVWSGRLLVDYDRYAIFHRLRIPFRIKNNSARNSEEVIEWICRNQLQRTDLTDPMRRYLIGRQYLVLKLLGAHHAASTPPPMGKRRMSSIAVSKYESVPIRIREQLGKLYHIRQETVERYASYAKAIDTVRAAAPELADGLLSGCLWLTVDRILELPYKTRDELQALSAALQNGENLNGKLGSAIPAKHRESASLTLPDISIKNMPRYDPDAEIASLTLTVPAWVGSIRRVNNSADFAAVSVNAKHAARKELLLLKKEVESMLHHIKKEM